MYVYGNMEDKYNFFYSYAIYSSFIAMKYDLIAKEKWEIFIKKKLFEESSLLATLPMQPQKETQCVLVSEVREIYLQNLKY